MAETLVSAAKSKALVASSAFRTFPDFGIRLPKNDKPCVVVYERGVYKMGKVGLKGAPSSERCQLIENSRD